MSSFYSRHCLHFGTMLFSGWTKGGMESLVLLQRSRFSPTLVSSVRRQNSGKTWVCLCARRTAMSMWRKSKTLWQREEACWLVDTPGTGLRHTSGKIHLQISQVWWIFQFLSEHTQKGHDRMPMPKWGPSPSSRSGCVLPNWYMEVHTMLSSNSLAGSLAW